MEIEEVKAALAFVPEVRITTLESRITLYVPALDDGVHFVSDDVRRVTRTYGPDGSHALEFVIANGERIWPLIIIGDDVVFQPESPEFLLDTSMQYSISGMPHLVAHTEMSRDAERFGRASSDETIDLDTAAGTLLMLRCFVAGAARFGMRPLAAVHWWERAADRLRQEVWLPPWRPDPVWDGLVAEATVAAGEGRLRSAHRPPPRDESAAVAELTVADFERLPPGLNAVGLDDEFVTAWRTSIPVTPETFHATLLRGIPSATADIALYPGGGGAADIWVALGDGQRAFLQLRFSAPEREMWIDEIRIPAGAGQGLFQRMMFNAEALATLLRLERVSLHATDVGAYALARVGVYPHDPELFRATREGQPGSRG